MKVKGLNGTRLNPKSKLILEHVLEADIKDIFGKVSKLKTTNTKPHEVVKRNLLQLCSQFYRTPIVTNNEFISWVVKGYM
jgi:hypothetical protein